VPRLVLVSGVIWGLWHVPLIIAGVRVGMEAGILMAVTLVLTAVVLCRGSWTYRRTPDELMKAPATL
jgi:hypothetical protein